MTIQVLRAAPQLRLEVADASQIGECRRSAQLLAERCGFDTTAVGRTGIIATELATNLLRHAGRGELLLQALGEAGDTELEMVAIDRGPGMADVGRCLQDGYSTAGSAGTGLGAIARLSSAFDLHSLPGQGTVVLSRVARASGGSFAAAPSRPAWLEFGAVCVTMPGQSVCGDSWALARGADSASLLVVDGIGHGEPASAAAQAVAEAFAHEPLQAPAQAMHSLHRAASGTRGAVAACARLDAPSGRLEYAGIGNISGWILEPERGHGLASQNGTLGSGAQRVREFDYAWPRDSRIVMHSDGLSSRWSIDAHAGLYPRHAAVIAAVLYRDYGRGRDDATVLVVGRRT